MTSIAPERTSVSAISRACSPVSGWLTQQVVDVDPERLRVGRVERVLRVDERRRGPPAFWASAITCRADGGLAGALGPVDLDDAAPREPADAEREVQGQRAGRDDLDVGEARPGRPVA